MPTINHNPRIVTVGAGLGQITVGQNIGSGFPFNLNAPGDSQIIQLNYVEKFAGFYGATPYADVVTGVTATRTLTKEFAWSNDGVTYSAYQTISTPNLAAVTPDYDKPFYLRLRYTRGGTDMAGVITFDLCAFNYSINASAIVGYGKFTLQTVYSDMIEFIKMVTENYLYQHRGKDHYEVGWLIQNNTRNGAKPWIFYSDISIGDIGFKSTDEIVRNIRFSMGIRTKPDNRTLGFAQQVGTLLDLWGTLGNNYTFSGTFKNVVFNDVTFRDFGISEIASGPFLEFNELDFIGGRFDVALSIRFEHILQQQ